MLYNEECLKTMKSMPDNFVDLVVTSPPYANQRKSVYGGIDSGKYVFWFAEIAQQIKRILKPSGSFFLNIKPHTDEGERSLYVFELVLNLRNNIGFKFIDEYCWTKNAFPGSHKGRFKNGFEPIYHFAKSSPDKLTFNPLACGEPIKAESLKRAERKQCGKPLSGMCALKITNIKNTSICRPSNVLYINNVQNQYSESIKHPAVFPVKLVEFFIKSFSNENDLVYDPFMGSGTTAIAAIKNKRRWIGSEISEEYCKLINERVDNEHSKT